MTITTLDPRTALVVIDLQQGIIAMPTAHPIDTVIHHASALAEAFRQNDLPVVLVNVNGGAPGRNEQSGNSGERPAGWDELVPELDQHAQDHTVTKQTWGAFTNTGLGAWLKERGVTQVVLAGVATSIGVESTARQAHELGFNVALSTDAMTDMSAEAHDNSIKRIFPRLGETGSTSEILAMLAESER